MKSKLLMVSGALVFGLVGVLVVAAQESGTPHPLEQQYLSIFQTIVLQIIKDNALLIQQGGWGLLVVLLIDSSIIWLLLFLAWTISKGVSRTVGMIRGMSNEEVLGEVKRTIHQHIVSKGEFQSTHDETRMMLINKIDVLFSSMKPSLEKFMYALIGLIVYRVMTFTRIRRRDLFMQRDNTGQLVENIRIYLNNILFEVETLVRSAWGKLILDRMSDPLAEMFKVMETIITGSVKSFPEDHPEEFFLSLETRINDTANSYLSKLTKLY